MTRSQAWERYFATGDVEPIIKAYWKSVHYIAWEKYPYAEEDMFQWGMVGLLKGIRTLDKTRVKNLDAWVWLNVKGMMYNHNREVKRDTISLNEEILPGWTLEDSLGEEFDLDARIDLIDAIKSSKTIDEVRDKLIGYKPSVKKDKSSYIEKYHYGEISLNALAKEMGVSKRQTYKLLGTLPESW